LCNAGERARCNEIKRQSGKLRPTSRHRERPRVSFISTLPIASGRSFYRDEASSSLSSGSVRVLFQMRKQWAPRGRASSSGRIYFRARQIHVTRVVRCLPPAWRIHRELNLHGASEFIRRQSPSVIHFRPNHSITPRAPFGNPFRIRKGFSPFTFIFLFFSSYIYVYICIYIYIYI